MTDSRPARLVDYDTVSPRLPHPIPFRQLVRMSGHRFPALVRPAGFKSSPLWLEESVVAWIRDKYSILLPEYCAILEREGLDAKPFHHVERL